MAVDKKRKRSEGQGKRGKAPTASSKRQKSSATKRVTSVDSLAWKQVEIPEMFDDAEGFYGLEEVQGVDVVREGNTVKFVSPDPASPPCCPPGSASSFAYAPAFFGACLAPRCC
jgi:ATP-dependent RNA helicase DDX24/MAK5